MTDLTFAIESPRPRRLSEEIEALLAQLDERPVTLREIIAVTKARAYTLLLVLLALPFCQPIPLPGLSTPLGALIALIGLRLSLRARPWLPARLLDAPVAAKKVEAVLRGSLKLARGLEVFLRPRLCVLVDYVVLHHFYGAMICICGVLMLLPLPIPFTNMVPAWTVLFLAAALMERDGHFIVAGTVMFAATLAFFGGLYFGGNAMFDWIKDWVGGLMSIHLKAPRHFGMSAGWGD